MSSFKLRSGITFTPEGSRYLVVDEHTGSRFRVGETEYQILKQFEEKTNIEEVIYKFRTMQKIDVPHDTLYGFVQQAITLGLLRTENDSLWHRLLTARASTFRFRLFDPNRALDFLMQKAGFLFSRWGLFIAGAMAIVATVMVVARLPEIWVFRSVEVPDGFFYCLAAIFLLSILHEMAHGLAGRLNGFEISEVGVHLHYFMPAFYCRILRRPEASSRSLLAVLVAGPLVDLVLLSLLLGVWLMLPDGGAGKAFVTMAVCMMVVKVWLIQLNPLWPYSDGFHIVKLLLNREANH